MNDHIYRNTLAEYEQRLQAVDHERKARKLATGNTLRMPVMAMVTNFLRRNEDGKPENQTVVCLQRES